MNHYAVMLDEKYSNEMSRIEVNVAEGAPNKMIRLVWNIMLWFVIMLGQFFFYNEKFTKSMKEYIFDIYAL